ncbi:phage tail protein [Aeromonas hydrophila]|uniref:phage tail-collar fiber domain-containing protein n=1 Tax=Aeromonas hydrophila TaxID=644 RepID=UPI003D19F6FC
MSQVITNAFASYWQDCLTNETPVVLDEFVLANIPGLDPDAPLDPDEGLPPAEQIVHRHAVDQRGRIDTDAVAYTIVMDTTVGDFEFNAMYLINQATGVVGMVVHKGLETKLKTDEASGQTGNSLVKSMLMEYDRASVATVTVVEAGTWQIDYAARLRGMDDDTRSLALPLYGAAWFQGDGFLVIHNAEVYRVQPGHGVVGGLLIRWPEASIITPTAFPMGVWVDVHRAGTLLGKWENHVDLVLSATPLTDYIDEGGYQHYVAQLATLNADNSVTDTRRQRTHTHYWDELVDPPSAADLGGLPQASYRPRTDSLNNQQGTIDATKNKDMDTCLAGEYGLYDTASTTNAPPLASSYFYCETISIYGADPGPGLLQMAYPYAGVGAIAWRNYHRSDSQWKEWVRAYDTAHKPTPAEIGAAITAHTHPGSMLNPIALTTEDLNTLITPGVYRQDSDANTSVALNYPEPGSGALIVTAGAGVQQRYHKYNSSRVYTRAQYGEEAFTPWALTYNTQNVPSAGDVGAAPVVHGHTPEECGAAPAVHGHSPDQCGAAPEVHGHDWSQIANIPPLGTTLLGDGGGSTEVMLGVANVTVITVAVMGAGRYRSLTFHVSWGQISLINRGGENADKDYDVVLEVNYDGWSLYLRGIANVQGIGQVYG